MYSAALQAHAELRVRATSLDDLMRADAALDLAVAGVPLAASADPGLLADGAHEPTPTPYHILAKLLGGLGLDESCHLLDVGCGSGRVLAYARAAGLPCRVTGVELDARLAAQARSWTAGLDGLEVVEGSALDVPLAPYTHFYLFNPFDSDVLVRFLDRIERQVRHRVVLVHMSDNGEWLAYLGRPGWRRAGEGECHMHPSRGGGEFPVFGCPQHYSIWEYDPSGKVVARASVV